MASTAWIKIYGLQLNPSLKIKGMGLKKDSAYKNKTQWLCKGAAWSPIANLIMKLPPPCFTVGCCSHCDKQWYLVYCVKANKSPFCFLLDNRTFFYVWVAGMPFGKLKSIWVSAERDSHRRDCVLASKVTVEKMNSVYLFSDWSFVIIMDMVHFLWCTMCIFIYWVPHIYIHTKINRVN